MKAIFYGLIVIAVIGTTIVKAQDLTTVQGGHCFTLGVPNYMIKTFELNEVASLQYLNTLREAYVIVIVDTKEELEAAEIKFMNSREFIENVTSYYQKDSENRKVGEVTEFVSNGYGHSQVEMSWMDEEQTEYYTLITVVETEKAFYQIMTWTIMEYKDKLKNDYLKISKSLLD